MKIRLNILTNKKSEMFKISMVCVCVCDLAAVVVEPQKVDSKWLKAFIACACARGT